jgi:hypothetical protein
MTTGTTIIHQRFLTNFIGHLHHVRNNGTTRVFIHNIQAAQAMQAQNAALHILPYLVCIRSIRKS